MRKMGNKKYAIYFNALERKEPEQREFVEELKNFYEFINCDTVDIVRRPIGGRTYCIICDDEGLLKEKPIASAVNKNLNVELVGNLIITGLPDRDGNLQGLTPSEAKHVISNFTNLCGLPLLVI